jgi:hypothetical protein
MQDTPVVARAAGAGRGLTSHDDRRALDPACRLHARPAPRRAASIVRAAGK